MLDQAVSEMKQDLVKMRQASAEVYSTQKMLETKYTQAQASAVRSPARSALSHGNALLDPPILSTCALMLLSCHRAVHLLPVPDGHTHLLLEAALTWLPNVV